MPNAELQFNKAQLNSLKAAVRRNPSKVKDEVKIFLTQGLRLYKQGIIRSPWTLGSNSGGAPVDTGNLRDTHRTEIGVFEARIIPTAPYAKFVHEGTKYMKKRPWLDWVKSSNDARIKGLERTLLTNITKDLAK